MTAILPNLGYGLLTLYINSNQTNLNLQSLLGTSRYQAKIDKKIIINNGVTIGATSTANYALTIPSGLGGRLYLINSGSIQGAGGAANGGTGGNAIFAGDRNVFIDNRGTIYAGGGGGGAGGTGGTGGGGFFNFDCSFTQFLGQGVCSPLFFPNTATSSCTFNWPGAYCAGSFVPGGCTTASGRCNDCRRFISQTCTTFTSGGGGGAGGSGGVGRGFNQSLTSGSAGIAGALGGTNAGQGGTGGTGGSGGDWGSSGTTGNTGNTGANGNSTVGLAGLAGSAGGLAGFYIVNNSNVRWINTGTIAGRIG